MASRQIHVDIISPERPLYSGPASFVVAPAHDGEVGILPMHAPMVAQLGIGEVRITTPDDGRDYYAVSGGFLQTANDRVIIITEEAKSPADVNEQKVAEGVREVQAQLGEHQSSEGRAALDQRMAWFKAQAKLAKHKNEGEVHHSNFAKSGLAMHEGKAELKRGMETQAK